MAETYTVIIKNETEQESTPVSTSAGTGSDNKIDTAKEKNSRGKIATALVSAHTVTPYISQAISFGISQIEFNTGSAQEQRKWEAVSSIAGSALSIASTGFIFGPQAAVGALVTQLITTAVSTAFKSIQIETQKKIDEENRSLRRSRLGMATNRSRSGGVV